MPVAGGDAGPDVTPVLEAMTLPSAALALGLPRVPTARLQVGAGVALLRMLGIDLGQDAPDLLRMVDALPDGPPAPPSSAPCTP